MFSVVFCLHVLAFSLVERKQKDSTIFFFLPSSLVSYIYLTLSFKVSSVISQSGAEAWLPKNYDACGLVSSREADRGVVGWFS